MNHYSCNKSSTYLQLAYFYRISFADFIYNHLPTGLPLFQIHIQRKRKLSHSRQWYKSNKSKQQSPSKIKAKKTLNLTWKYDHIHMLPSRGRGCFEVLLLPSLPFYSDPQDYDLCPPSSTFEGPQHLLRVTHPLPQLPNSVLSRPILRTSQFVQGCVWLPVFLNLCFSAENLCAIALIAWQCELGSSVQACVTDKFGM